MNIEDAGATALDSHEDEKLDLLIFNSLDSCPFYSDLF